MRDGSAGGVEMPMLFRLLAGVEDEAVAMVTMVATVTMAPTSTG